LLANFTSPFITPRTKEEAPAPWLR
jgi:hypothetical protein